MEKEKILDEVEKTLCAYDKDVMLEANPFLITRINTEIENRMKKKKRGFAFRFGLNQALMLLILVINILTLVYYYDKSEKQNLREKLVEDLRADFQIDQSQNNF